MSANPLTPLLDTVNYPTDLRALAPGQLRQLADELRAEMISAVGQTGGHLGSGLGVVELTVALHYVFNTPEDRALRIAAIELAASFCNAMSNSIRADCSRPVRLNA